jgi:hypothetical protein
LPQLTQLQGSSSSSGSGERLLLCCDGSDGGYGGGGGGFQVLSQRPCVLLVPLAPCMSMGHARGRQLEQLKQQRIGRSSVSSSCEEIGGGGCGGGSQKPFIFMCLCALTRRREENGKGYSVRTSILLIATCNI